MCFDCQRASACLAWALVLAYSFAPFHVPVTLARFDAYAVGLGLPYDLSQLGILTLHLLAFAAVGFVSRFASAKSDLAALFVRSVLLRGLLFCVAIEVVQSVVPSRHAELTDLAANVVGFTLGHLTLHGVFRLRREGSTPWLTAQRGWLLQVSWALFWSSLLLLPRPFLDLDDWDLGYPLTIGGEREQERHWAAGDLDYLAVYDRVLRPDEMGSALAHPPSNPRSTPSRLGLGLLVAYDFTHAGWLDVEPQGPIDDPSLRIRDTRSSRRSTVALTPAVASPLVSVGSAGRLTTGIVTSGSFSIEVWCRTPSPSRRGDLTIFAISETMWRRNVAIGVDGRDIFFCVRNALNGPAGSRFALRAPDAIATDRVQLIATYDDGVSSVFLNGRPVGPVVDLREPSVLLQLGEGRSGHFATALLCVLSLIVLNSSRSPRRAAPLEMVRLALLGYAGLLWPLIVGPMLSFRPALSLYVWFLPAFILSSGLIVCARPR